MGGGGVFINYIYKTLLFAIRAENVFTTYFLLIRDLEEKELINPQRPFADDRGHSQMTEAIRR